MKVYRALPILLVSMIAIVFATDPGHFAFKRVDAGGHKLRMLIRGKGSPAVIFESGGSPSGGGPLEYWEKVQPAVSRMTTTISYDRAGCGWSEPGPPPRDARQVAVELHTALTNAGIQPPYILVGHSFGGPLNRVFAAMFPGEVRAMVLLDPTQEEFVDRAQARETNHLERTDQEWKEIKASLAEAHASAVPPSTRVILITAMGPKRIPDFVSASDREEMRKYRPMWLKSHETWLKTVTHGTHVTTEESGHAIPFEQPALVIQTIRECLSSGG